MEELLCVVGYTIKEAPGLPAFFPCVFGFNAFNKVAFFAACDLK